jgi:7,8-didemethyl-8-hydroxy-5-deazariboflavin synthase CofG subunit
MNIDYFLSLLHNDREELVNKAFEKKEKKYKQKVTFSRNIFVPVTHQCRNRCGYCGFVSDDPNSWITPEKFKLILKKAKESKCKEVLFTLGEKPEEKYESASKFLNSYSFQSTVEYVENLCMETLEERLLPHSNLGILSYEELEIMKECNASLGLMLETSSPRLSEKNQPHFLSPGKDPKTRLEVIRNAGKLSIPFTTGLLVGIGENWEERIDSLLKISKISREYKHIQEVIIQNFNPQKETPMENHPPPSDDDFLLTISLSRLILSPEVSIQIPPNLNKARIISSLKHGANDLGGISPVSIDYINPEKDWHNEIFLKELLNSASYVLQERLPIYPQYEKYLNNRLREIAEEYYQNEKTLST